MALVPTSDAFRSAFSKAPVAMLLIDKFGRCVDANEEAAKYLDRRRSALLKLSLDKLLERETTGETDDLLSALTKRGSLQAPVRPKAKTRWGTGFYLVATRLPDGFFLVSLERKEQSAADTGRLWRINRTTMIVPEFFPLPTEEGTDYQSLFQHSPYGISIIQDDRIVLANPVFCKLLGYRSSDDVLGKEVQSFLDEGSRMFFSLLQQRIFRGETIPTRFEIRMLRENGAPVDVETSFALSLHKGAPALNLSISDITDRKELERRLMDSEGLLRNVINSMVDALVITDLQGKVLDVNDEFERFTGFARREAFGAEIPYPWVPEEELRSYMGWLEQLRENNVLRDFDITWLRKNNDRVAVSLNTTLLRNSAGEPVLMVNIARDISERQASSAELGRQLQRLRVLYDLSSALTEAFDTKEIARITYQQVGKVIPIDSFSIDLYQEQKRLIHSLFSVNTIEGERVELQVPSSPIALDASMPTFKALSARKPILELRGGSLEAQEREGSREASASVMYVPMISKDRAIGILSVKSYGEEAYSEDHLTLLQSIANVAGIAIEKTNLYLETVNKSLEIEARNKELDDFTYVVSHDLKEPLISVEGFAKMIRHDYLHLFDSTGQEYLQSIVDSCWHMKRLIDELLILSRISKLVEKKARLDLSVLVAEVLEELRFSIRERKAEIIIAERLPEIVGVDTHLRIVFRNLISNALKFSDKPIPRIEIGASVAPDFTTIYVRDNGIGIDEAYFEKIFLIFQRLHRKDQYEGAGAGLAIVKKIVESHGGQIRVVSRPGLGSTFSFTIPTA
jgi:PAS domain S-box-containing protein